MGWRDLKNKQNGRLIAIAFFNALVWYYIWKPLERPYDPIIPEFCGITIALSLIFLYRNELSLKKGSLLGFLSIEILLYLRPDYADFNFMYIPALLIGNAVLALPGLILCMILLLVHKALLGKASDYQKAGIFGGLLNLILIGTILSGQEIVFFIGVISVSIICFFAISKKAGAILGGFAGLVFILRVMDITLDKGLSNLLGQIFLISLITIPLGTLLIKYRSSFKEGALSGMIAGAISFWPIAFFSILRGVQGLVSKYNEDYLRSDVSRAVGQGEAMLFLFFIVYLVILILGVFAVMAFPRLIVLANSYRERNK